MGIDSLTNSASMIAGFASAALVFRIQRELQKKASTSIAVADWLLITAAVLSFVFVILPFSLAILPEHVALQLAASALSSSVLLLSGYMFAILAHYRLILGSSRRGPRHNPEPSEKAIVWITFLLGAMGFLISFIVRSSAS